jgi:hypothetical protein
MARINITSVDEYDGSTKLVGWFDDKACESWMEATEWDGHNRIGRSTRSQWDHEVLIRTAGGRWVLNRHSQRQGVMETYEFVGSDRARDWLLLNGHDDEVERLFGEPVEPERGPGRPEVGPMVNVRMEPAMIERLDEYAGLHGLSRAETIRQLVARALAE